MRAWRRCAARARPGARPANGCSSLLAGHIVGILKDGLGSVLLTDLENLRPENRDVYVARRDEFERGVRKLIEEGMKAGEFHCDDSLLAGFSMLGSINWITKWFRADGRLGVNDVAVGMSRFLMGALYCPPDMIPAPVEPAPEAEDAPVQGEGRREGRTPGQDTHQGGLQDTDQGRHQDGLQAQGR